MNSHLLSILLMRECKWTAADFFSYFFVFLQPLTFSSLGSPKKTTQNKATVRRLGGGGGRGDENSALFETGRDWSSTRFVLSIYPRGVCFSSPAEDTPPPCTGAKKTSMAAHYRQQPIRAQGDSCAPSSPPLPQPPDDDSSRWTLSLGNGQERYCMMLLICSLQGNKMTSLILYFFFFFFLNEKQK